jgi:hypothetical protein
MKRTAVYRSAHTGDYLIGVMRSAFAVCFISVASPLSLRHCLYKWNADTYMRAHWQLSSPFPSAKCSCCSLYRNSKKLNDGQKYCAKCKCWPSWEKPKYGVSTTVRTGFDSFSLLMNTIYNHKPMYNVTDSK